MLMKKGGAGSFVLNVMQEKCSPDPAEKRRDAALSAYAPKGSIGDRISCRGGVEGMQRDCFLQSIHLIQKASLPKKGILNRGTYIHSAREQTVIPPRPHVEQIFGHLHPSTIARPLQFGLSSWASVRLSRVEIKTPKQNCLGVIGHCRIGG